MAKAMRIEFVSKETIKPSSPTPQNLGTHKLSFIDQLVPAMETTPILLYYLNTHEEDLPYLTAEDKLVRLKTSLSQTLTYFYPLAGRVRDNAVVECNDDGAEFCVARVHGFLSDILKEPDANSAHQFMPKPSDDKSDVPLVKVQANVFECGGLVIGLCLSHKIADAGTLGSFIRAWSSVAVGCMTEEMAPKFVQSPASLYPSMDRLVVLPPLDLKHSKCITRRFVFDSSKIQKLKAKAKSNIVNQPTRVEAVLSLIWKCATIASRTNRGITTPSMVNQVVNIRKRVSSPLAETCVGNFLGNFIAHTKQDDNNYYMELQDLVVQLRKGLEEFCKVQVEKLQQENGFLAIYEGLKDFELVYKDGLDLYYGCSSWCRFGFYDSDFGWGKPKWVSIPCLNFMNNFTLMDTNDGKGIEAWVSLTEEDMALMEINDELLEFVSPNPSVI